jgi:hypothetical protein
MDQRQIVGLVGGGKASWLLVVSDDREPHRS